MKIGIFGDSYADPNPKPDMSWSHYLNELLEPENLINFGSSGTSHWWSYEKFLKQYRNFDTIVFCHTSYSRWPHLPEELTGRHWQIQKSYPNSKISGLQKQINGVFFDIFSHELLTFIGVSIFNQVNELCKKENIKLVNIIMHDDYKEGFELTDYPILFDINKISLIERTIYKNKDHNLIDVFTLNQLPEPRANHLLPANNRILAKLIKDHIDNNNSVITDLSKLDVWQQYDPISNDWFGS